ncbi:MAG: hypothetical protein F4065_08860 [Rhodothermaceae bacterium]|nr:hypothetical protein [Rhodothermaceae bacterium]MXZ58880.1 hypothetical protein [Rhodothermaceae bacterium]MYB90004.1 hypothetical protein [Rhodothermaceae bacterium]MYD68432.1 hypothetical protein [Rhodothermaceae bacterium]MYG43745.1 hypothetical protein [Rhodothermaceae bacterium]
MNDRSYRVSYWGYFSLALFIAGCATLDQAGSEDFLNPSLWQPIDVIQDTRQLVLQQESGQPRDITTYMAARMVGVQPIFGDSLIFPLQGSRRVIKGGRLGNATGLGESFWPDPRSGSGAHTITEFISPEDPTVNEGLAVVLPKQLLTSDRIHQLVQRGTEVILGIGDVAPRLASNAGTNAMVLEVTRSALASISGLSADSVALGELPKIRYVLPEPVSVEARIDTYESPLNVMGFIAGQDPQYASQLIIVIADPSWISVESDSSRWMPSAILMELARQYAAGWVDRVFPRRSLLVATGTGAALHAVFEYPVWARQNIHAVIALGRSSSSRVQVGRDTIPVFGYDFPEVQNPENLEAWITMVLEQIHDIVQQLDS